MKMYNPAHPGRILAACFDESRTIEDTAQKIGVPAQDLIDIINGKAPITLEMAILLSTVLTSTPPRIWLKLQERYDSWQAEHNDDLRQQIFKKHKIVAPTTPNSGSADLAFA